MKLSIIIPVHNTEPNLLKRCLSSIMANNLSSKEFEIIIIDDNSNSEYFYKYKSIKERYFNNIINRPKKKSGVSAARNLGIKISKGKYLTFIDSDDTIPPTFLKTALKKIDIYKLDAAYGEYTEICNNSDEKKGNYKKEYILKRNQIVKFQQAMFNVKNDIFDQPVPFIIGGRIIKRECVPFFDETLSISEDQIWNFDILENTKKIGIFQYSWYNYIRHVNSVGYNSRVNYIEKRIPFWKKLFKRVSVHGNLEYYEIYYSKVSLDIKNAVYYYAKNNNKNAFKNSIHKILEYEDVINYFENYSKFYKLNFKDQIYFYILKRKYVKILYFILNRKD